VTPLSRRPGERGQRFAHLLAGEAADGGVPMEAPPPAERTVPAPAEAGLGERVERLETEVAALRSELLSLREQLGA
jgi:uncharacterized protein YceH (UPF0502 family)